MTSPRKGQYTKVPISQTRQDIDQLLRKWGARKIAWADDLDEYILELQFVWYAAEDGTPLQARFRLDTDARAQGRSEQAVQKELRIRHRLLLYWLEGAFNAVDAGIVTAETIFLPWLAGPGGVTVAEALLPHLKQLPTGGVRAMLQLPEGK